jgi:hypothetical protein
MLEFCFAAFFPRGHTLHVSICVFSFVFLHYFCCFLAYVCLQERDHVKKKAEKKQRSRILQAYENKNPTRLKMAM